MNPNPEFRKNILAGLSVPSGLAPELARFLRAVKQHLQLSHGTKGQPKERFVTVDELRAIGLIDVATRGGRSEVRAVSTSQTVPATGSSSPAPSGASISTKIAGLSQGHVLRYSTSTQKWENVQFFEAAADVALRTSLPAAIAYRDEPETITGEWTFNNDLAVTGSLQWGGGPVIASSSDLYPSQLAHAGI
jgi:hypothetical protein